jgi:YidC/Oxa1 family membrane protein insertase
MEGRLMGDLFNALIDLLGSVLSFFYDFLVPPFNEGWGYGLSIILLTVVINVVVFPLTLKQTRATRAFTALQPEIKKIQAEFKDDPQEMQKRLMAAQKAAGATPGGCLLPLLVQMPIWFALFRLLRTPLDHIPASSALAQAVGDGGASFLGMHLGESPSMAMQNGIVTALPYLIIIVFMVATQYVQQWHSTYGQEKPERGGGAQQAVTKIMPLFIGFVSWNFPAGLVLYWATSNLFRLGQQVLIFRIDGRPTAPPKEAPKEAPKAVGSGEGEGSKKPQQGSANKRRRRRRS